MITDRILLDALAQWMHAQGIAVYNTDGFYPAGMSLPAVVFGAMPDTPHNAVTVNVYDTSIARDDTGNPDYWVQFRFRADGNDPRTVGDMADQLAAHLLDHTHVALTPQVEVRHAHRTVRTPVGMDTNRRYERADSYRLSLKPLTT